MIIPVHLADRSYNVCIDEPGTLAETMVRMFPQSKFLLITNTTIEAMYGETIRSWEGIIPMQRYVLEDGEQYKTIESWREILDFLLQKRLDRGTVIIAYGGGVVGDLAGFAASSFMRGVAYVQVPTTLLAMVDSSVGGKTGVNHPMGKNLIGSIYQPKLVWITTDILRSLSPRHFLAGYAEVFKYAFIGGSSMFDFIEAHHEQIVSMNKNVLEDGIKKSIEIKARIVSEDEHEAGNRALLNFGHTFGHALERFYGYKGIIHGEGVSWGMHCAVDLGKRVNSIPAKYLTRYDALLQKLKLPALPSPPDLNDLYTYMFSDKKVRGGKIRFVLPTVPGTSVITPDVPEKAIIETLREVFEKRI